MTKVELYNDHFENAKSYQIPSAQLIIADIPYNLGKKRMRAILRGTTTAITLTVRASLPVNSFSIPTVISR